MENYSYVVGIDLGTTNTLVCYYKNGKREFLQFTGRGDATEILKKVKKNFVKNVGCSADEKIGAVITVPAYFNNNNRNKTRKAGESAGFDVVQIIEKPVAAAIASIREEQVNKKVLVINVASDEVDLTILKADEKNHIYKSIAFDGAVLPSGGVRPSSNVDFDMIRKCIENFLKGDKNFSMSDIGHVVLSGDSKFIPGINNHITKIFGFAPVNAKDLDNSDKIVAYGAALVGQSRNSVESKNYDGLVGEVQKVQQMISQLRSEIKDVPESLAALTKFLNLKSGIGVLESQREKLADELAQMNEQRDNLNAEIEKSKAELNNLQEKISAVKNILKF